MINKKENYQQLLVLVQALLDDESDIIANLANVAALLYEHLSDLNWVGFYLKRGHDLVVGPFQGKVACSRIHLYKGVCGRALELKQIINVPNVHEFEGHIVCDSASNSELVIPLIVNDQAIGVLDIDAPILNRFDQDDETYLSKIVALINKKLPDSFNREA